MQMNSAAFYVTYLVDNCGTVLRLVPQFLSVLFSLFALIGDAIVSSFNVYVK